MPKGDLARQLEIPILFLIIGFFLTINIITASLSPTVWSDEVMFSDPAISLHLKGDFTSTAWYAQRQDEFWSGNAPLHSMILAGWLLLAPITPSGVRSINFIYISAAVVSLWHILRSSSILTEPFSRLLFTALALTGNGIAFSYRSGRYDALGVLLTALIALSVAKPPTALRLVTLGGLCALLPWAGLHLFILAFVVVAAHGLIYASIDKRHILAIAGAISGAFALLAFLLWMSTFGEFVRSVLPHTNVDSNQFLERTIAKLTSAPRLFYQDPSVALLLPVLPIAFLAVKGDATKIKLAIFLSICIFTIPLALHAAGKFPTYYSWAIFIPLCVVTALGAQAEFRHKTPIYIILSLSVLAGAVGLPARLAVSALDSDARNHQTMSDYVSRAINTNDRAYVDFAAYYPAKLKAAAVFLPPYLQIISSDERASITVAVLQGENSPKQATRFLSDAFGGNWIQAHAALSPARRDVLLGWGLASPYVLNVYRRSNAP